MSSFQKPIAKEQLKSPFANDLNNSETKLRKREVVTGRVIVPNGKFVGGICPKANTDDLAAFFRKVERYGFKPKTSRSSESSSSPITVLNSRKKNSSFSGTYSPDKNSSNVNYYSDTSINCIQTADRKHRVRRSLSSSPIMCSHYAGAKFSEPPSPALLPLPPAHWIEAASADSSPRSLTPVDFELSDVSSFSTPLKPVSAAPTINQTVELFFKNCSFNHMETCKDFTQQLKTLLNVSA